METMVKLFAVRITVKYSRDTNSNIYTCSLHLSKAIDRIDLVTSRSIAKKCNIIILKLDRLNYLKADLKNCMGRFRKIICVHLLFL